LKTGVAQNKYEATSILTNQLAIELETRKKDEISLAKFREEKESMDTEQILLRIKLLDYQTKYKLEEKRMVQSEEKIKELQENIEKEQESKETLTNEINTLQNQLKTVLAQNESLTENIKGLQNRFETLEARMSNEKGMMRIHGKEKNETDQKCEQFKAVGKHILQQSIIDSSNYIPRPPLSQMNKSKNTAGDDESTMSAISVSNLLVDYNRKEHGVSMDQSIYSYTTETDTLSSDQCAIRLHAQKMLALAEKQFEKNTSKKSDTSISSTYSSNFESESLQYRLSVSNTKNTYNEKENTPPQCRSQISHMSQMSQVSQMSQMSGMDSRTRVVDCTCNKSIFSGNAEHTDFFLPKLGLACKCGAAKRVLATSKPAALRSLLRPWQVSFLKSVHIYSAEDLIVAQETRSKQLVDTMRQWRYMKQMKVARSKSCFIALQIWAKTAQTACKSAKQQQLRKLSFPDNPSFLEIKCGVEDDDNSLGSVSTLGEDSFRGIDMSMDNMLLEGEYEV